MAEKPLSIKDRIIKILSKKKLLVENDIKKALAIQKEKGGKLSDILVGMGIVSRNDLVSAISEELSIPPIDLSRYKISPNIIKRIPKKIVTNYRVIPVSKMENFLTIATADPLNILAMDDIAALTGCKISVVIASDKEIEDAISLYYNVGAHEAIEKIIGEMKPEGDIEVVEEKDESSVSSAQLVELIQEAPVVKVTNMLLSGGVRSRASDILIEPLEDVLRIRYRVDGILKEVERPAKKIHAALISRLKVISNLNIAERRLPQDGRFKAKIDDREVDFRISVIPSSNGEKVALRILDKSQATLDLEKLGFEKEPLDALKKAAAKPHGMILSCGPTGCGKTTTLYSVLKHVDSPEKNIITAEDPVEYQLEGINQLTVQPAIGLTFASSLRSFLRQDPDVIMVGEIRDFETVDIAIKAALTGHLVLSTLHTTTASGSIVRLVNMGVEPFLITSSVIIIAAQRLVRKICDACKESYKIDDITSKRLGLKPGDKNIAYKGNGCKACRKTGYKGRVGLVETLVLSPEIRNLILENAQEHKLREQARREGMHTLRENGIKKILGGVTTVEEILRVTIGEQDIPA
ncbi:MAG: Flp pilus assembly complex ATPase component TadA [Candidatus Omnitrophota bacterium]|nr:MAG: Flp pilus assembly complex ATPase component TadA [Candidatus Omnitrophota bacterium]